VNFPSSVVRNSAFLDCIVPVNNFFLDGIPVNNLMLWHFSVVSKKFRQAVVISQRHLVTEEEKNHSLERAREFKSKTPFCCASNDGILCLCGIFHGNVAYFPMLFRSYLA
jgi:hypothetical protein